MRAGNPLDLGGALGTTEALAKADREQRKDEPTSTPRTSRSSPLRTQCTAVFGTVADEAKRLTSLVRTTRSPRCKPNRPAVH